jgi:hypothetical protein
MQKSIGDDTNRRHAYLWQHTDRSYTVGNPTLMTSLTPSFIRTAQQYQQVSDHQYSYSITGKQKPMQAEGQIKPSQSKLQTSNCQHLCTRHSDTQHNTQHTNSQHIRTLPTQHNRYQNTNYSTKIDTQYNTLV